MQVRTILLATLIATCLFSNAQTIPSYVPTNGLVGWWPFTGNAIDVSGNNNNGTVTGASLVADRFGNINCAYSFNSSGSGNYITIPNSSSFNFNGSISFSLWLNSSTSPNLGTWLMKFTGPTPFKGFSASFSNLSNSARWDIGNGSLNQYNLTYTSSSGGISVKDGTWHHVVGTFSGNVQSLYVDGILVDTTHTQFGYGANSNPLIIGKDTYTYCCNNPPRNYNGLLDDIGIWNRALTPSEIQQLYQSQTPCNLSSNFFAQDTLSGCGNLITLNAGNAGATYTWNTGATSQSINVNASGWYRCTVSQGTTCSVTDSIYISLPNALPSNLQTGLVGYWPFCGNANDESGNGNNGISVNSIPSADRFGNVNCAYSFDGNGDYIRISHSSILRLSGNFSISSWVKPTAINTFNTFVSKASNNQANVPGWVWGYSNFSQPTKLHFQGSPNFNGTSLSIVGNSLQLNEWKNVVVSYDSSTSSLKYYIDGVNIDSFNVAYNFTNSSLDLFIGNHFQNNDPALFVPTNGGFTGNLDDIGIWNRALTPSEIQQLYQNQSPCILISNFFAQDTINGCGNLITLDAGNTGASYFWNNGATTQTINASSSGWYRCTVNQEMICTVADSIYINILNADIVQADTSICTGSSLTLSATNSNIASNGLPLNLQPGLIGWWPFNGNANDESGNGHHGTILGASLASNRFGELNKSYTFDGLNDLISIPDFSALNFGTNDFTYSVWFNALTIPPVCNQFSPYILGQGDNVGTLSAVNYFLGRYCTTNFRFITQFNGITPTNTVDVYPTSSFLQNQWYSIIVTRQGSLFNMYKNGQLIGSQSSSTPLANPLSPLTIGGISSSGVNSNFHHGRVDDFGIWNRALSSVEIQQLVNGDLLSYLWSTGATTPSITVSPTQTTTYYVTVSNGISSCVDSVTVTVLQNTTWYADGDGDGYGSATDTLSTCTGAPDGYVGNNTDCNDLSATAYPGAAELCNSIDDDCDNLVDEGLAPVIGPVTGAGVQCIPLAPGSASFSIAPVPGATDYFWTAPAGTAITSANDTTSVTIAWNSANAHDGISGPLTVTVTGACGQLSSTQTIDIHLQISVPVRPASISGPVKLCPGDSATFSTASVSRARGYVWSVPNGMSIVDGQGSNILRVVATAGFQGGSLSVSATNACGTGPARSKTIGFNVPSTPGAISGNAAGLCGLQDIAYSIPPQTGINQYSWTAPAGTVLSGSGNSVQLDFDNTFTSGNLSVVAINGCGTSLARNLALTGYPARPGSITGPLNLCPGSNAAYGVATVNGTSSYTWTPISGATGLIGQGTKNISFTAPATSSTNNNLSVAASNGCGSSAVRSLGGITVDPSFCVRMSATPAVAKISAYPNPAQDILFLKAEGYTPQRIELYNLLGECVMNGPWNTTLNLKTLRNGLYILRVRGNTDAVVRIEIMRD